MVFQNLRSDTFLPHIQRCRSGLTLKFTDKGREAQRSERAWPRSPRQKAPWGNDHITAGQQPTRVLPDITGAQRGPSATPNPEPG